MFLQRNGYDTYENMFKAKIKVIKFDIYHKYLDLPTLYSGFDIAMALVEVDDSADVEGKLKYFDKFQQPEAFGREIIGKLAVVAGYPDYLFQKSTSG